MNIAQIAGKLRGKIGHLSGELSVGLTKVMRRFVAEAMYGIAAKGSVQLSEIARVLEEPIAMKKTVDGISSRLGYKGLNDHLTDRIIDDASCRITDDTLSIIDPSEITKKYAKKMQYLDTVRDGSEGELSIGQWTCDGVAAEVGEGDILPLYHELYSPRAPGFKSENAQILIPLLDTNRQFLIRLVGTRQLVYRGRSVEARQLAASFALPYAERIVKEQKGKEKQYSVESGFCRVQLPHRSEQLYLLVVKGFGEAPLMLLTTVPMRKKRTVLWWAAEAYLTRWRAEETIRYIKQCYDLEDIRVMTYERLRNMAALVLATAYFTAVHLGLRSKLQIVAGHALRAAKHIFGIPNFRYYALADGIKDILSRSRCGIDVKVTKAQPQAQLPLLL